MTSPFLLSQFLLAALGFGAAFHPATRSMSLPARFGISFMTGALLLAVEATLFSTIGILWSVGSLALPLILLNGGAAWLWSRRVPVPAAAATDSSRISPELWISSLVLGALSLLHLAASFVTSRNNSVDLVYFWGVKALLFAEHRGIDPEFLRSGFVLHAHPTYPPLFTMTLSWSALVSGGFDWVAAPLTSVVWIVMAIPVLFSLLRQRLERSAALVTTVLWTVVISISLVSSYSGGNAEAALLVYGTVAATAVLIEPKEGTSSRFLPGLCLAGCGLAKVEGLVIIGLLLAGTILRDALQRRPHVIRQSLLLILPSLVAGATWPVFEMVYGLRLSDPLRRMTFEAVRYAREIFTECLRRLDAGTWGASWIVSLLFLLSRLRGKLVELLPGLSVTFGILAFYLVYYFSHYDNPTLLIGWTLSRISQPALSILVISAGLSCFSLVSRRPTAASAPAEEV